MALSPGDAWLIGKAVSTLTVVRCALWTLPFAATRRVIRRLSRPRTKLAVRRSSAHRVAWAVRVGSRIVPGAGHCLTQALATQVLLARRGQPAELHFGIERGAAREFTAHAWVESEGEVVSGGPDVDRYIRLAPPSRAGGVPFSEMEGRAEGARWLNRPLR